MNKKETTRILNNNKELKQLEQEEKENKQQEVA